ncbi:vesicle transport protein GOT1B [Trichuris trichiura]|uniref:Vesicle transport protein GOT1B n=1 Tax=Trichuris trichiura TaxID=36087 RepID=A0A077ZDG4_TRITR|nr:vesicle transport protein GOT1B [Trichuris trichiura]
MIEVTDCQKIGVGLAGFGVTFVLLGVVMLFDKGLLAIGNVLFISGLTFVIGIGRTLRFFFQPHKLKGTMFFFTGIIVVLVGWPVVGMLVESYGFVALFGYSFCQKFSTIIPYCFSGFIPVAVNFLRRIPVLGTILNLPGIRQVFP